MTQTAPNTVGAGQQTPFDSTSEAAVSIFHARQIVAQMEGMIPVQIKTVHPGSGSPPIAGTVDVQILVSILDGSGNQVKQGIVYGLPYFRIQGGPWAIVCDPVAGDVGFIVCATRDISNLTNGATKQVMPGSNRQNSYSDGIYIGGAFNSAPKSSIWLKPDGTFAIKDQAGNQIVSTLAGMTLSDVNANQIQMTVGAVNVVTTAFQVNGVPVTVP
jgi:hypothetical protein